MRAHFRSAGRTIINVHGATALQRAGLTAPQGWVRTVGIPIRGPHGQMMTIPPNAKLSKGLQRVQGIFSRASQNTQDAYLTSVELADACNGARDSNALLQTANFLRDVLTHVNALVPENFRDYNQRSDLDAFSKLEPMLRFASLLSTGQAQGEDGTAPLPAQWFHNVLAQIGGLSFVDQRMSRALNAARTFFDGFPPDRTIGRAELADAPNLLAAIVDLIPAIRQMAQHTNSRGLTWQMMSVANVLEATPTGWFTDVLAQVPGFFHYDPRLHQAHSVAHAVLGRFQSNANVGPAELANVSHLNELRVMGVLIPNLRQAAQHAPSPDLTVKMLKVANTIEAALRQRPA